MKIEIKSIYGDVLFSYEAEGNDVISCWHYGRNEWADITPEESFRSLWESINGPGSWDANPFVWVVEFEVKTK